MTPTLRQLAADITAFICSADPAEESFNRLARALFEFQFEHNGALRSLCAQRGLTSARVSGWKEIPAVPAGAFKEMELTVLPPAGRVAVFHSSGTTAQRPSQHFHSRESLAVYEASVLQWFEPHLRLDGPPPVRLIVLTPPPGDAPRSSLVHMFEAIRCAHPANGGAFFGEAGADGAWGVRFDELFGALVSREPVALLGTAFNFVHLLDHLAATGRCLALPPGSSLMETGGYKGRSRTLPKDELHAALSTALGISRDHIVCEYGMSELSSQAYDSDADATGCVPKLSVVSPSPPSEGGEGRGEEGLFPGLRRSRREEAHPLSGQGSQSLLTSAPTVQRFDARVATRLFRFPPWARFQIVSPETGREVPDGEPGLVRVCDLANVASALVVQTEDLAIRRGAGFELLGRASASEPRGCSLRTA